MWILAEGAAFFCAARIAGRIYMKIGIWTIPIASITSVGRVGNRSNVVVRVHTCAIGRTRISYLDHIRASIAAD